MKTPKAALTAVLLLLGALLAPLALTPPAQAEAPGWSSKCKNYPGDYASVCLNVHSSRAGNGVHVDQLQLCAYHLNDPGGHFRGTKNSHFNIGVFGSVALNDDPSGGGCAYTYWTSGVVGVNACWSVSGTLDIAFYDDGPYSFSGRLSDGAAC